MLCFGNKLDEKVCCGFIFANLFNSPYLLVKLWWNILISNLATNFQDLVARVKNVITLVPVLGTILCPDHCSINWMGNCYGWETWCHVDCWTGFISWFSRHIHNMKIINEIDNKFFGLKKISILLIAYVLTQCLCLLFIVFVLCYLEGCQHSFVHSFLMVILPSAV